ncbi:hypothetical protein ACWEVD_31430 [Nocardia thailandica]
MSEAQEPIDLGKGRPRDAEPAPAPRPQDAPPGGTAPGAGPSAAPPSGPAPVPRAEEPWAGLESAAIPPAPGPPPVPEMPPYPGPPPAPAGYPMPGHPQAPYPQPGYPQAGYPRYPAGPHYPYPTPYQVPGTPVPMPPGYQPYPRQFYGYRENTPVLTIMSWVCLGVSLFGGLMMCGLPTLIAAPAGLVTGIIGHRKGESTAIGAAIANGIVVVLMLIGIVLLVAGIGFGGWT